MKKTFFTLIFIAGFLFSCQNQETTAPAESIKTAYVDTSKLMEAYNEAKDIDAKYKSKSEEMGKTLEAEVRKFRGEVENYEKNAQTYGMQWAQQKGKELQEREQELALTRQSMIQSLQEENGKEMDSLVTRIKKKIIDFGKEKGFDYIFGTGDAASVLYAKNEYNITEDVIKMLNDAYDNSKTSGNTDKK